MFYITSGDVLIGAPLPRNTYNQPIVAHAQLTDDNFAACLCLLCTAVPKRETRLMCKEETLSGPSDFFFLLLRCVKLSHGTSPLLFVLFCPSSDFKLPPRLQRAKETHSPFSTRRNSDPNTWENRTQSRLASWLPRLYKAGLGGGGPTTPGRAAEPQPEAAGLRIAGARPPGAGRPLRSAPPEATGSCPRAALNISYRAPER